METADPMQLTPEQPAPRCDGRLLLCNIGRVGDTILRNSILDSAFRTYATIDYICGPNNVELIRNDHRFDRVIVFCNNLSGFASLFKAAATRRYDSFIELKDHWSSTSGLIAMLFRSRLKTGFNNDRFHPFDRDVSTVFSEHTHKIELMRRIGELAGLERGEYKPTLILPGESIRWFQENYAWEKPFIFLNISATAEDRTWPVSHWARYVRGCGLEKEPILVSGVPADRVRVEELCSQLPGAVAFKPRRFMDVAAALVNARLVLTVDTGVVHACSALNKPIVVLSHSVTDYAPLSTRKLVISPEGGGRVMQIDPETAIKITLREGLP
jgi:ADP-heptose:LPS heptosyltransferase